MRLCRHIERYEIERGESRLGRTAEVERHRRTGLPCRVPDTVKQDFIDGAGLLPAARLGCDAAHVQEKARQDLVAKRGIRVLFLV